MSAAEQVQALPTPPAGEELAVRVIEGEPRILDTDLAERLGFANRHKIRHLIQRHAQGLAALGVLSTVDETRGRKGGRPGKAYYLNRRQALFITAKSETLIATDITVEIVRRFDEYERGGQPVPAINLRDPASLLRLSADLARELQTAHASVAALAPRAAAWEQIAGTVGLINISNFAKTAGVGPREVVEFLLRQAKWCFRRHPDGPLIAYQPIVERGWMTHKLAEYTRRDGSTGTRDQVYLTPAGAARLGVLLEKSRNSEGEAS